MKQRRGVRRKPSRISQRAKRETKAPVRVPALVSTASDAPRTFYDPKLKCVVDAKGNRVTPAIAQPLTEYPATLTREQYVDRLTDTHLLYACETADEHTIVALANVAQCSVAELEYRRRNWGTPPRMAGIPLSETWCGRNATAHIDDVPFDRRLCLPCPLWTANPDVAPF